MKREALAVHEVGHALAGWLMGDRIYEVTLSGLYDPSDPESTPYFCRSGSTAIMTAALDTPVLNRELAWRFLSGMAAERALGYEGKKSGDLDVGYLQRDVLDRQIPADTIDMFFWRLSNPGGTAAEFAEFFLPRLVEVFASEPMRRCLQAGAEALLDAGTLSGQDLI